MISLCVPSTDLHTIALSFHTSNLKFIFYLVTYMQHLYKRFAANTEVYYRSKQSQEYANAFCVYAVICLVQSVSEFIICSDFCVLSVKICQSTIH